jgi:hypothetical protein
LFQPPVPPSSDPGASALNLSKSSSKKKPTESSARGKTAGKKKAGSGNPSRNTQPISVDVSRQVTGSKVAQLVSNEKKRCGSAPPPSSSIRGHQTFVSREEDLEEEEEEEAGRSSESVEKEASSIGKIFFSDYL